MTQIQSSVGLITGIPIFQTVDQLMVIAARPRDLIVGRNSTLQSEQIAVNTLSSLILGLQFEVDKLKASDLFQSKVVSSSNSDVLSATLASDGSPAAGSYVFTPIQTATSQQLLTSRFGEAGTATGVGSFTFQTGGFVDQSIALDQLNNGDGVARGKLNITDGSGTTATVDLRYARSIDDVIDAINLVSTILRSTSPRRPTAIRSS